MGNTNNGNPARRRSQVEGRYEREVFVSYAWGGESEEIVDELERAFRERGINIVRDKKDLHYRGSIREFMRRIGQGQCVVLVISAKYLRSEYCMYELLQVSENQNLRERIFPIVLADANIYNPVEILNYVRYWDARIRELDRAIKQVEVGADLEGSQATLNKFVDIRASFDSLADTLRDMNALTPDMHAKSGFSTLIRAVENTMRKKRAVPPLIGAGIVGLILLCAVMARWLIPAFVPTETPTAPSPPTTEAPLPLPTDTPTMTAPSPSATPTDTASPVPASETPIPSVVTVTAAADRWWPIDPGYLAGCLPVLGGPPCPTATPLNENILSLAGCRSPMTPLCIDGLVAIKFDPATAGVPQRAKVNQALLRLFVRSGSDRQIRIQYAESPWNEGQSIRPRCGADNELSVEAVYGWNTWDVTAIVQSHVANPSLNYGFCLYGGEVTFSSREVADSSQPYLEITYQP